MKSPPPIEMDTRVQRGPLTGSCLMPLFTEKPVEKFQKSSNATRLSRFDKKRIYELLADDGPLGVSQSCNRPHSRMSHQPLCLGALPSQLFYLAIQVLDLFLEVPIQRLQCGPPFGC